MMNGQFRLIVPHHTVEWYSKGQHCTNAVDGDLILMDHGTWEDDLIKFGQEALVLSEPDIDDFTWCAHTAFVRGRIDEHTAVSEMGPHGYERRALYDYRHHEYAKVHFNVPSIQRDTAVKFDTACEGVRYGWLQYPIFALDGVTGEKWACSWGDTIICSTKDTLVLMGLGLFPDRPPSMVVPARMAKWCGAKKPPTGSGPAATIIVTPGTVQEN